ncbi:MAG: hypothetical protein H5T66_04180 [Chloroflexi bacterium]|nr:hypothetical protein [Chloroflexota bacterium]
MLDRLEELVGAGRRVPFSRRVAIDGDAFRKIIAQMWIVVPQEIKRAQEFELERDRLIARAQEEAERLIAQAREDAARLLDEHDIRRQAEQQAEMLLKHAEEQAARIRADADEYAARTLRELADQVEYLRRVIANGISVLEAHRREQLAIAQGEQPSEETDGAEEEALTPVAEPPEKAADETDQPLQGG